MIDHESALRTALDSGSEEQIEEELSFLRDVMTSSHVDTLPLRPLLSLLLAGLARPELQGSREDLIDTLSSFVFHREFPGSDLGAVVAILQSEGDPEIVISLLNLLGASYDSRYESVLKGFLENQNEDVAREAHEALAELGSKSGDPESPVS